MLNVKIVRFIWSLSLVSLLCFSVVCFPLQEYAFAEIEALDEDELIENVKIDKMTDGPNEESPEIIENELEPNEEPSDSIETETEPTGENGDTSTEETDEQEATDSTVSDEIDEKNEASENTEEDITSTFEIDTVQLTIHDIVIDNRTATMDWSINHDAVDKYIIFLGDHTIEISGDTTSYTFTGLKTNVLYWGSIEAYADGKKIASERFSFEPDWSDIKTYPVKLELDIGGATPNLFDQLQIHGLDESNNYFYYSEFLTNIPAMIELPAGTVEVVYFNSNDPSISQAKIIDFDPTVDYEEHPIRIYFPVEQIREQANPFDPKVINVTEDSITITWNEIIKLNSLQFDIFQLEPDYPESEPIFINQYKIKNDTNEFTIDGLTPDTKYFLSMHTRYDHQLMFDTYLIVKTAGEKMVGEPVQFKSGVLKDYLQKELGIYHREIFESDLKQLTFINSFSIQGKIDSLEGLQHATNLDLLELREQEISDVSALQGLTALTSLNLEINKVKDISSLENLINLTYLNLSNNEIEQIDAVRNLTKLTSLNVTNNNISSIDALNNLHNVTSLHLAHNNISDVSPLASFKKIRSLFLDHNEIESIDSLVNLTTLETISVNNNKLSTLPDVRTLTNVTHVELAGNDLRDISSLLTLKNLGYLDVSNNELTTLPELNVLERLFHLRLANTNITDITPLKGLDKLRILHVQDNEITDISVLKELQNLETIYLSNNEIEDISVLTELPKLKYVDLRGMNITDYATIQTLQDKGVTVHFDEELGEDKEDETDKGDVDPSDEKEPIDEDEEEKADKNPSVDDDTIDVQIDRELVIYTIKNPKQEETISYDSDLIKELKEENRTIVINRGDVQIMVPTALVSGNEDVVVTIKKLPKVKGSFSDTFRFTILEGGRERRLFSTPITLVFKVDTESATNPHNLKVFYLNEETGEWELIGGTYHDGYVTVETNHFSVFTVMEVTEVVAIDDDEKQVRATDTSGEHTKQIHSDTEKKASTTITTTENTGGKQLPKTATNYYQVLFIGLVSFVVGFAMIVVRVRKKNMN